jgi:hypothetical protein
MRRILLFLLLVSLTSCVRYIKDAKDTLFQETKASTLLKKYEYFKEMSAQLDKKVADISIYSGKIKSLEADYAGVKRPDWARDDREQLSIWKSEFDGVKASYNSLAAEYNSAMSKINYSFCNVGDLPAGAATPLPREYKPYIYE